jgi:PII-like signaling protein
MTLAGAAERLSIFIGEDDQFQHHPLYTEIVNRAQRAGLAGATVLRGFEGFGPSHHIHTTRLLSLSTDLPIVVMIVDTKESIDAFLQQVQDLITEGLVIREDVEIVKYVGRTSPD